MRTGRVPIGGGGGGGGGWSLLPEQLLHCLPENQVVLPEYDLLCLPDFIYFFIRGGGGGG